MTTMLIGICGAGQFQVAALEERLSKIIIWLDIPVETIFVVLIFEFWFSQWQTDKAQVDIIKSLKMSIETKWFERFSVVRSSLLPIIFVR